MARKESKTGEPSVRIYIITVLYNRRIHEIRSFPEFRTLLYEYPETGLIIADNSTEKRIQEQNRKTAEQLQEVRYVACGGNVGLSRAYNRALSVIPKEQPFWVMLSDDDTWFSLGYLENGCRRIRHESNRRDEKTPLRMLCGIVQTKGGWISPRTRHTKEMAVSSFLRKPAPGIYQDLYPINSGWFLEGSTLLAVGGFDERLFLDQIDFLLMDRLRESGVRRIGVLPGEIRQEFSGELRIEDGAAQLRSSIRRWEIFRKDFDTYCDLTQKPWFYHHYLLSRRRLMLFLQRLMIRMRSCKGVS